MSLQCSIRCHQVAHLGSGVQPQPLCNDLELVVHKVGGAESMAIKFHGNVHGEVRVNFLALSASKPPHFHVCCPQIVPNCSCACSFELSL